MKKIAVLTLFVLMLGVAAASADPIIVYTIDDFNYYNKYVFETGEALIENFQGGQVNNPDITITATGVDQGVFQLGYYQNVVDDQTGPSFQTVTYAPGMNGWGGWFDLANVNNPGASINIEINGIVVGNIPNTYTGQFWGVFLNSPFTSVVLRDGLGGGQETYQIVDMAVCPVPIPGSLLLLGSGILGIVGIGIRRKSS